MEKTEKEKAKGVRVLVCLCVCVCVCGGGGCAHQPPCLPAAASSTVSPGKIPGLVVQLVPTRKETLVPALGLLANETVGLQHRD